MSIFNTIVKLQNKSLTGTWNPVILFMIMFSLSYGIMYLKSIKDEKEFKKDDAIKTSVYVAIASVVMNYITGNIFVAKRKLYKSKGFSKQRSHAQAYANARQTQLLAAFM